MATTAEVVEQWVMSVGGARVAEVILLAATQLPLGAKLALRDLIRDDLLAYNSRRRSRHSDDDANSLNIE